MVDAKSMADVWAGSMDYRAGDRDRKTLTELAPVMVAALHGQGLSREAMRAKFIAAFEHLTVPYVELCKIADEMITKVRS